MSPGTMWYQGIFYSIENLDIQARRKAADSSSCYIRSHIFFTSV